MVTDPIPPVAPADAPTAAPPPVRARYRLRFTKDTELRFVSHHDLMRCFTRMLRRADLPFASTAGFHPHPRLNLPLSLALGLVGHEEVAELELTAELSPEEVRDRLARQAPPGLVILSVRRIHGSRGGQVRRACYRVQLPSPLPDDLPQRCASLMTVPECWIERTRPQPRRINLRPYLHQLRVSAQALEMDLWVTPTGTARPEEVLDLLGLAAVLDQGVVMERTRLELEDEMPPDHAEGNA